MSAAIPAPAERRVAQAGEQRLARVESLRALAALGVVAGHLWAEAHGYGPLTISGFWRRQALGLASDGVWVFFALTGYLLYRPFARRDHGDGGRIDLGLYARNRALRILPLYYAAIVVVLLAEKHGAGAVVWWRHLLLVQNIGRVSDVDGPLWSVVVELQFYALLPLLAAVLAWVARGSRGRTAAGLLTLGLAAALARQLLALSPADAATTFWAFQLPTTLAFFAAGMLLALLAEGWSRRAPAWIAGPLGARWLWLAAALALWVLGNWRFAAANVFVPAAFLTVGAVVLPLRPWRALAVLDRRPLALLGVASYSLYVWHIPVIHAFDGGRGLMPHGFPVVAAAIVPVCLAAAAASYVVVERPALRLRRRWSPSSPAPPIPSAP